MVRRFGGRGNIDGRSDAGRTITRTHNAAYVADLLRNGFHNIDSIEREIAALIEEHIDPLRAAKADAWKKLRAGSEMKAEDIRPLYALYKRDRDVLEIEDQVQRERSQDALRQVYETLQVGQTLSFLSILPEPEPPVAPRAPEPAPPRADDGYTAALGREAYAEGKRLDENPGPPGSGEAHAWEAGWREAEQEEIMSLAEPGP